MKEKLQILFVCVENARRSQMGQGFAEVFGKGKLEIYSVGSRPSSQIIGWLKERRAFS